MRIEMTDKDIARFIDKIKVTDNCWEWQGKPHKKGYGTFKLHKRPKWAHRISYSLWRGELIEGLVIMHECDNKICVNPQHLEQGTSQKNTMDAVERGLHDNKGIKNPQHKLKEDDVRQIRYLRAMGIPRNRVAVMFNVSERTIYSITQRQSWAHID